jgi:PRTRC genetic system protein E
VFEELMPLLTRRVLVVTLSRVSDEQICVNIIPKPLSSDRLNEAAALATPLSVTGSPKELDEQLPRQLAEFVEAHLGLSSTLKIAKEQMDAAAKAAREAAKKSTTSKSYAGSSTSADEPQSSSFSDSMMHALSRIPRSVIGVDEILLCRIPSFCSSGI